MIRFYKLPLRQSVKTKQNMIEVFGLILLSIPGKNLNHFRIIVKGIYK